MELNIEFTNVDPEKRYRDKILRDNYIYVYERGVYKHIYEHKDGIFKMLEYCANEAKVQELKKLDHDVSYLDPCTLDKYMADDDLNSLSIMATKGVPDISEEPRYNKHMTPWKRLLLFLGV